MFILDPRTPVGGCISRCQLKFLSLFSQIQWIWASDYGHNGDTSCLNLRNSTQRATKRKNEMHEKYSMSIFYLIMLCVIDISYLYYLEN